MGPARLEYQKHIRVGYHESNRHIVVSIPDKFSFPSEIAYVFMRDQRTLIISPDPFKNAFTVNFHRNENLPGCRQLRIEGCKIPGRFFKITPCKYEVDGRAYVVTIPEDEKRPAPRAMHRPKTPVAPAPVMSSVAAVLSPVAEQAMQENVTINGFGSEWRYRLTIEQMLDVTAYISRMLHEEHA